MGEVLSPGVARAIWIRDQLVPWADRFFARYPHRRSLLLSVAQYWDDSAIDAVHAHLMASCHEVPAWPPDETLDSADFEAAARSNDDARIWASGLNRWLGPFDWVENLSAVRPFQALCGEGGDQNCEPGDQYLPCVLVQRWDTGLHVLVVGEVVRPWLDLPQTPPPTREDADVAPPPRLEGAPVPEAEQPFHDAIAARPLDDGPRRVLSDHRQEQGDALADFSVPPEPSAAQQLLLGERALGELVGCVPVGSARFRHGTLADCVVSFDFASEHLAGSPWWRTVHTLRLCPQGEPLLSAEMKGVRHLSGLDRRGFDAFEAWPTRAHLLSLGVQVADAAALARLSSFALPALERMVISGPAEVLQALEVHPRWGSLQELVVLVDWGLLVGDEGRFFVPPALPDLVGLLASVPRVSIGTVGSLGLPEGFRVTLDRRSPAVARVVHDRLGPASAPQALLSLASTLPAAVMRLELVPSPVWRAEPFASTRFEVVRAVG